MNGQTISLFDRTYQEVVDDLLTAIVGGVVNEPILFDVKEDTYPLAKPATDIRSITGTQNGVHHSFQKLVDYAFSSGNNSVAWLKGGLAPDDETVFYVDYYRPGAASPLSDTNVGSVTRTVCEAVGREITTVYAQINLAYLAGFIDTATGKSLDFVVSILGITRRTAEFAIGLATFFRDPGAADGTIYIPDGTALTTAKGEKSFVTTEPRTLQRGQARIDAPIQATEASKGDKGIVSAGEINTLPQPISGITSVTNFDATFRGQKDETDGDLRLRAKAALHGLGKATLAALTNAILEEFATVDSVWDPNGPPPNLSDPGTVTFLIKTEPKRFPSVQNAVAQTRAAGVKASLVARYVFFKPHLRATIAAGLTPAGKIKLVNQIIGAIQQYVDSLAAGTSAQGQDILKAITQSVKELKDPKSVQFADVIAWRADVAKPKTETLVGDLVAAVNSVPAGDPAALSAAIADVLAPFAPPTEQRVPDRGLVLGPSGQPATDQDIAAGQFQISAKVNGEDWSVALDLESSDIVLVEH